MQRRTFSPELPFSGPTFDPSGGPPSRPDHGPAVLSVGELDRRLKRLVEAGTADVNVEGEVSSVREVGSGHVYFTLKDEAEDACIDCVLYRTAPPRSRRLITNGARVVLVGRATVYAARGRLQLIADLARPAGRGALLEALERLKEKLAGEGLFDVEKKRPLPPEPKVVGVVTSGDGAALHDIVKVAFRRAGVRIVLARAPVQGAGAAQLMAKAVALLQRMPEVEVIIIGRGGGSADDLSAFNDEVLVRAVAACPIPIVSAVGHEIDTSLTDLAADARAATPSQAAELVVPDASSQSEALLHLTARLHRALRQRLGESRAQLDRQRSLLGTPARLLGERRQRLDDARQRLEKHLGQQLEARRAGVTQLERRLLARHPSRVLGNARAALGPLEARLHAAAHRKLAALRGRLAENAVRLDALSPLSVLGRGYAIATSPAGQAVLDPAELSPGDVVRVRVHKGSFEAVVSGSGAPRDKEREPSARRKGTPPASPGPRGSAAPRGAKRNPESGQLSLLDGPLSAPSSAAPNEPRDAAARKGQGDV